MDVQHLAAILRENGDKVLNSTSKLSLSTTLLKDLNNHFGVIIDEREALNSTFQVIGTSSSKIELLFDLQFLHDFVQRTVSLKLTPPYINYIENDFVDIRKFKNLKVLEIRRISIKQILGLQCLRTQLQHLICIRAVDSLKELFVDCGGDKSERYIWSELKEAVLTNNNLKTIDNSLEYVPWLQYLDLSHNKLINVQAIDCLTNLKQLNLSFNQLEAVPLFNKEISRKLQILILKNNYIEDLTGLAHLINLITLDLSCNCLIDHQSLTTLPSLTALQWLSFEGNPLYFHPQHRILTTSRLHSNTSTVKFILDGHILSKSEMAAIGTYNSLPVSRTQLAPNAGINIERDYLLSISSDTSVNTNSSDITAIQTSCSLTKSQSSGKKSSKLRAAIIAERDDNGEIVDDLISSITSIESIEKEHEHLETKKQIETLRSKYGESWLQSVGGSLVQDVLGMPKLAKPISSSPYEEEFKLHASEIVTKLKEHNTENYEANGDNDKTEVTSDMSTNNTFATASESSLFDDKEQTLDKEETLTSDSASVSSDEEQLEGGNEEHLYLVQIKYKDINEPEEIFLLITDKYIKEKDLNGQVKCKWQLEMLIKCELISNQPPIISLQYDTVRINFKNREYILNEDDVPKLMLQLNDIINRLSLNDINQTTFNCMKCSCLFKVKTKLLKSVGCNQIIPTCPNCHSTIVYEVDNSSQTNQTIPQNTVNSNNSRPDSPSECSIGSAASVQESSSSQIDDMNISENALKRYESDIEVISNPSQSSIEVLDDQLRPGRKRSSEERKPNIMPTIPDVTTVATNTLPVALTESSSSSSFTESVCTTYDNQLTLTSRPDSCLEVGIIKEEEESKENITKEEKSKSGLISSIFESLFTSPKEGTRSTIQSNGDKNDEIKFNFSDNFSNVDHRIKLYLYQHIFEDEHEDFVWLLKCSLLCSGATQIINACLVLSTQKVYILQIKNYINSYDLPGWLVKKDSYTINRLQTVFSLPWKQGIGISINAAGKETINHLCILQDMQYTSNFFNYLVSNPLPDSCDLVSSISERPMMNLQQSLISYVSKNTNDQIVKPSNLCLLTIFSKCTINNNSTRELTMGVLVINSNDLILIQDLTWLMPESKNIPDFDIIQPISNLIELEFEENIIDFHFLDEVQGYEEIWCMEFATENSMKTTISAIKTPWEQIFSVPLQVNYKVHSV